MKRIGILSLQVLVTGIGLWYVENFQVHRPSRDRFPQRRDRHHLRNRAPLQTRGALLREHARAPGSLPPKNWKCQMRPHISFLYDRRGTLTRSLDTVFRVTADVFAAFCMTPHPQSRTSVARARLRQASPRRRPAYNFAILGSSSAAWANFSTGSLSIRPRFCRPIKRSSASQHDERECV